jgi:hypothetical protein
MGSVQMKPDPIIDFSLGILEFEKTYKNGDPFS